MPFLLNKKTVIIFAVIVVLSFFAPTVFAVWNGTFYEPGDTLNPECLPTDVDCDVRAPLTSLNISDAVYGAGWDTDTTHAPSKNALYDKIEGLVAGSHDPISLGVSANGLSLATQVLSLALASTSTTGALSDTDWDTFNNKQNALTSDVDYLTPGTATSTYLPYTGGTTNVDLGVHNLTVDTNSLFVDSVNHRVGIGTTGPIANLDITGDNSTVAIYNNTAEDSSGGRDVYLDFYGNTAAATKFKQSQIKVSSSTATVGNQESRMDFYLNSGAQGNSPTANPLSLIDNNAGYGGTVASFSGATSVTLPSSEGDLFGAAGVSAELRGRHILYLSSGTTGGTEPIIFRGGTTEKMRMTYDGNVGIGTTSPLSKLSINGGLHVGGDSDAGDNNLLVDGRITAPTIWATGLMNTDTIGIYNTNTTFTLNSYNYATANRFAITAAGGTFSQDSGTNGALKIIPIYNQVASTAANTDLLINRTQTAVGSGAQNLLDAQVGGVSKFSVSNTGVISSGSTGTQFHTETNGGIYISGALSFGNNAYLNYGGTVRTITMGQDGYATTNQTFRAEGGRNGTDTNYSGASLTLAGGPSTGTGVGGSLIFQTSGTGTTGTGLNALTTRMTIDSTGKVGIGESPTANLSVKGLVNSGSGTNLSSFSSLNNTNVFIINDAGAITAKGAGTFNYNGSNNISKSVVGADFTQYNSSGTITNYIQTAGNSYFNGGNVGIGKTSPTDALQVNGTIRAGKVFFRNVDNNDANNYIQYSSGDYMDYQSYNAHRFFTYDGSVSEKFRITQTGNVGIGTATPTSKIHGVTTLSGATGDEVAYSLDYTTNKATSGNDTGLLINMTDTASPGTSLPLDIKVGGSSKFSVSNTGAVTAGNLFLDSVLTTVTNTTLNIGSASYSTAGRFAVSMAYGTHSETSGSNGAVKITPTYNQASGTAANTDLLINRTETAVGSGAQYLIDAQVGGVSKFSVNNTGAISNTDTITTTGALFQAPAVYQFRATNSGNAGTAFTINPRTNSAVAGQVNGVSITPTYNQTSGTAANTDLLINRTQTAVGSGAQYLIDAQVGGVSKFKVDNTGSATLTGRLLASGVTPPTLASQTSGGVDESLNSNYEAVKFTMSGTSIGGIELQLKRTGTISAGTIAAYLYTDSGGAPGTNISDTSTGQPTLVYGAGLTTSYETYYFREQVTGLTNGASYWIVIAQSGIAGGGSVEINSRTSGTALHATSADASSWATEDSKELYYVIEGDTGATIYGFATNQYGLEGQSYSGFGVRGISVYGAGAKFDSTHNFGVGGSSIYGVGLRGSSVNGIAIQGISTGSAGAQFQTTAAGQVGMQVISTTGVASQAVALDPTGILYQGLSSAFSPVFQISNDGSGYFAGNTGIGVAATSKLDILDTTLAGSAALAGSVLNLAQTWNTTGAPTAIKLNVTNTASDAASLLMDLQVGGVSKFSVSNAGVIQQAGCTTAGTLSADVSGNIICTPSSERFKNTVNDLDDSLSNIMALRPVSYNFNSDMNMGDRTYFGFISEEVADVTSEFATYDKEGAPYGLDTNAILASTVKAIQEMNLNLEDVRGLEGEVNGVSFFSRLLSKLTTWLADTGNGIKNIFVEEVNTKEICISNETGEKTCITKTQLDALILNANITAEPESTPEPEPAPVDPIPVDPAPVDPAPTELPTLEEVGIPTSENVGTEPTPAPEPTPDPAPVELPTLEEVGIPTSENVGTEPTPEAPAPLGSSPTGDADPAI